jgi:hypothetical protein
MLARYGDEAVDLIRTQCIDAHRRGDRVGFLAWREIGTATDDLLLIREEALQHD